MIAKTRELFVFRRFLTFRSCGGVRFFERKYHKGGENDNFGNAHDGRADRIKLVGKGRIVIIRKAADVIEY